VPRITFSSDIVVLVEGLLAGFPSTLITIAFLAVSVIALVSFQSYLTYDNILSQQKTRALLLATSQIETLRDYQVLNNTSGYTSWQSIASGSSSVTGNTATYTVTWTVTSFANPTYKNVDVTVTWTDQRGTAQSVKQDVNIAGIDPQDSSAIM
jgi:Tfp pilus assembly protein PilE